MAGHLVANREVPLDDDDALAETLQLPSRDREGRRVAVEAQEAARRRRALEEGDGMAAGADRAVQKKNEATFAGPLGRRGIFPCKLGEYFGQENRLMKPPIARSQGP